MAGMWRIALAMLGISMVATAAHAAPPPLRPLDIVTTHALCEGSRQVTRSTVAAATDVQALTIRTIVIDPGHGGENEGAIGVAQVREKLLTLELAYELRDALEARHPGVKVLLTRYWDRGVGLHDRTEWANRIDADLFLSLHYNAATHDRAIGYETYFLSDETMATTAEPGSRRKQEASKPQRKAFRGIDRARVKAHKDARKLLTPPHTASKSLADVTQKALAARLESANRGVKQANFAVLRGASMPAVVIESGFLTHPVEGQQVLGATHRKQVVEGLVSAIETFDALQSKPAKPKPVAQRGSQ
jgi:N-acetylmuramoyl-L-alanine amidase